MHVYGEKEEIFATCVHKNVQYEVMSMEFVLSCAVREEEWSDTVMQGGVKWVKFLCRWMCTLGVGVSLITDIEEGAWKGMSWNIMGMLKEKWAIGKEKLGRW